MIKTSGNDYMNVAIINVLSSLSQILLILMLNFILDVGKLYFMCHYI